MINELEERDKFLSRIDHRVNIDSCYRWAAQELFYRRELTLEEFSTLACPWPISWFEYVHGNTGVSIGTEVKVIEVNENETEAIIKSRLMNQYFPTNEEPVLQLTSAEMSALESYKKTGMGCKWIAIFEVADVKGNTIRFLGAVGMYLDRYGKMMAQQYAINPDIEVIDWEGHPQHLRETWLISKLLVPIYFAISLLNCKNVYLQDQPVSRQQRRLAERQKRPLITYKELVVEPMKKIVKAEILPGESGIKKALHICRGHFKDYRDGKGLFGKFHDLYWWDMHARGNKKYGEVKKTYKVITDSVDITK